MATAPSPALSDAQHLALAVARLTSGEGLSPHLRDYSTQIAKWEPERLAAAGQFLLAEMKPTAAKDEAA